MVGTSVNDLFQGAATKREIYFVVPGEVRGKGRPRTRVVEGGHGKSFANVYTDAKTRKYEARLSSYAMKAKGASAWDMLIEEPLRIDVIAMIPIPKSWSKKKRAALDGKPSMCRIDCDNICKALIDSCNEVLFRDDKIVTTITCSKFWVADPAQECLKVRVASCG